MRARVCACVFVFGLVALTRNPILIYPLTLTTTEFQPQSKTELQDAVKTCGVDHDGTNIPRKSGLF